MYRKPCDDISLITKGGSGVNVYTFLVWIDGPDQKAHKHMAIVRQDLVKLIIDLKHTIA